MLKFVMKFWRKNKILLSKSRFKWSNWNKFNIFFWSSWFATRWYMFTKFSCSTIISWCWI
jgi:hypothetical protein